MQFEEEYYKDFLLKRQAKAYARKASIHGLTYIAEDGRPNVEKEGVIHLFLQVVLNEVLGS